MTWSNEEFAKPPLSNRDQYRPAEESSLLQPASFAPSFEVLAVRGLRGVVSLEVALRHGGVQQVLHREIALAVSGAARGLGRLQHLAEGVLLVDPCGVRDLARAVVVLAAGGDGQRDRTGGRLSVFRPRCSSLTFGSPGCTGHEAQAERDGQQEGPGPLRYPRTRACMFFHCLPSPFVRSLRRRKTAKQRLRDLPSREIAQPVFATQTSRGRSGPTGSARGNSPLAHTRFSVGILADRQDRNTVAVPCGILTRLPTIRDVFFMLKAFYHLLGRRTTRTGTFPPTAGMPSSS